jgi:hypothetical protein
LKKTLSKILDLHLPIPPYTPEWILSWKR